MESLKKENQVLRKAIEGIIEEIERQKQLNSKHQTQIETLLGFNERLLIIIESELGNKKDNCSLQPISERSQRESDLIGTALNSLIQSRRLAAKSQSGKKNQNLFIESALITNNKLNDIFREKQCQESDLEQSFDNDDISQRKIEFKTTSGGVSPFKETITAKTSIKTQEVSKTLEHSNIIKQQMSQGIAELKKFRSQGAQFYDEKIKEIKGLSSRLNTFKPNEQLKHITQKLALSRSTSDLLKRTVEKGEK